MSSVLRKTSSWQTFCFILLSQNSSYNQSQERLLPEHSLPHSNPVVWKKLLLLGWKLPISAWIFGSSWTEQVWILVRINGPDWEPGQEHSLPLLFSQHTFTPTEGWASLICRLCSGRKALFSLCRSHGLLWTVFNSSGVIPWAVRDKNLLLFFSIKLSNVPAPFIEQCVFSLLVCKAAAVICQVYAHACLPPPLGCPWRNWVLEEASRLLNALQLWQPFQTTPWGRARTLCWDFLLIFLSFPPFLPAPSLSSCSLFPLSFFFYRR